MFWELTAQPKAPPTNNLNDHERAAKVPRRRRVIDIGSQLPCSSGSSSVPVTTTQQLWFLERFRFGKGQEPIAIVQSGSTIAAGNLPDLGFHEVHGQLVFQYAQVL